MTIVCVMIVGGTARQGKNLAQLSGCFVIGPFW